MPAFSFTLSYISFALSPAPCQPAGRGGQTLEEGTQQRIYVTSGGNSHSLVQQLCALTCTLPAKALERTGGQTHRGQTDSGGTCVSTTSFTLSPPPCQPAGAGRTQTHSTARGSRWITLSTEWTHLRRRCRPRQWCRQNRSRSYVCVTAAGSHRTFAAFLAMLPTSLAASVTLPSAAWRICGQVNRCAGAER